MTTATPVKQPALARKFCPGVHQKCHKIVAAFAWRCRQGRDIKIGATKFQFPDKVMKRIFQFSPAIFTLATFILFALAAASSFAQCTPPPSGLVGWWKGDGTATDLVVSNTSALVNASYTNGIVGQAFSFDPENLAYGTYSGVQIADRPAYALTNALTIEGWIRPRGTGYYVFFRGDGRRMR